MLVIAGIGAATGGEVDPVAQPTNNCPHFAARADDLKKGMAWHRSEETRKLENQVSDDAHWPSEASFAMVAKALVHFSTDHGSIHLDALESGIGNG